MTRKFKHTPEIRDRAAEIRRDWTPTEKLRRTGLPPDMPRGLRAFILGSPQRAWCLANNARTQNSR